MPTLLEDAAIVALYWARDEQALSATAAKFGAYCRRIALNLLGNPADAEECLNDTWLAAWNSMPQNRPDRLAPYLGRITRNLALDRRGAASAQKRGGGQADLAAFLPAPDHPLYQPVLCELVRVDLEYGWKRGRPVPLEDYRGRFPDLEMVGELEFVHDIEQVHQHAPVAVPARVFGEGGDERQEFKSEAKPPGL